MSNPLTIEIPDHGDAEVNAMAAMHQLVTPLDWGARIRAAEWLLARLKTEQPSVPGPSRG